MSFQQTKNSLPSPPNSSCGDEKESEYYGVQQTLLPENYTIDHSSTTNKHRLRSISISSSSLSSTSSSSNNSNSQQRKRRRKSDRAYHRCKQCNKVYKHPNCLSKHQWEHSEEWEFTSKFLLTKHQQVQLLEAAAILMNMLGSGSGGAGGGGGRNNNNNTSSSSSLLSSTSKEEDEDEDEEEDDDSDIIQIDMDDELLLL